MDLNTIVHVYRLKCLPKSDVERDWFRNQDSFSSAVELASLAINSKGKRFSHQRRIRKTALEKARTTLLLNIHTIEKTKTFDDLITLIDELLAPIDGLGELYVYDTSFRIGVNLGMLPKRVYMHSGTRNGARKLGLDVSKKYVEITRLPKEFILLEPYQVEDILCIFKGKFKSSP